jgi:hypothetical protein
MQPTLTDKTMAERIEYVARERFAWPGGYALGLLMADGEPVCSACVAENLDLIRDATCGMLVDPQWKAVAAYYTDADDDGGYDDDGGPESIRCGNCNRPVTDATYVAK